jgi:ABC-type multidrug transport system fused ATPase/permease subunit
MASATFVVEDVAAAAAAAVATAARTSAATRAALTTTRRRLHRIVRFRVRAAQRARRHRDATQRLFQMHIDTLVVVVVIIVVIILIVVVIVAVVKLVDLVLVVVLNVVVDSGAATLMRASRSLRAARARPCRRRRADARPLGTVSIAVADRQRTGGVLVSRRRLNSTDNIAVGVLLARHTRRSTALARHHSSAVRGIGGIGRFGDGSRRRCSGRHRVRVTRRRLAHNRRRLARGATHARTRGATRRPVGAMVTIGTFVVNLNAIGIVITITIIIIVVVAAAVGATAAARVHVIIVVAAFVIVVVVVAVDVDNGVVFIVIIVIVVAAIHCATNCSHNTTDLTLHTYKEKTIFFFFFFFFFLCAKSTCAPKNEQSVASCVGLPMTHLSKCRKRELKRTGTCRLMRTHSRVRIGMRRRYTSARGARLVLKIVCEATALHFYNNTTTPQSEKKKQR